MNVGWRFLKSLIYPLMVMVVPDVFLDVTLILCMEPWIQVLGNYRIKNLAHWAVIGLPYSGCY